MALSKKYNLLLTKARMYAHPMLLAKTSKLVKSARDIDLVIIHQKVENELKKRGILDNE